MKAVKLRRFFANTIRRLGGAVIRFIYQIRIVDRDRIPARGGALLLPNHVTFIDAFLISAASPRLVRFVMDDAFMGSALIRVFVGLFETITICQEKPLEAIRRMVSALKNGELICLFPEGQLSRTGVLCDLQRGFELTAKKAGYPLIPMSCIGSWGSIFSFAGGKFLHKWPRRLPYGVTFACGPVITPQAATLENVRSALLAASAAALAARFDRRNWREPGLRGSTAAVVKFRQLDQESRRRVWINGYQIGLVGGIERRGSFQMLKTDFVALGLLGLTAVFPQLFGAELVMREQLGSGVWVGGEVLRSLLDETADLENFIFYDFSERAEIPFQRENGLHLPCFALAGLVVSMSLPQPLKNAATDEIQSGQQAGSLGKLLPGWYLSDGCLLGPAALPKGLLLPVGMRLSSGGFMLPAAR
jgi:acyl-[acyl-carrier-protein]-phospholipid O-acyltransferase / long-chain-fatty-acid--[acyl-carrier-protein] ligase